MHTNVETAKPGRAEHCEGYCGYRGFRRAPRLCYDVGKNNEIQSLTDSRIGAIIFLLTQSSKHDIDLRSQAYHTVDGGHEATGIPSYPLRGANSMWYWPYSLQQAQSDGS
jgi:hypothetical protein